MTEMIQKEEDGAEKGTSERETVEKEASYLARAQRNEQPTLRTSQGAQVRGYLESIADSEFVRELQKALSHARQLTGDAWRLEIRAGDVDIVCEEELEEVETSFDSVLDLASESVGESCDRAAEPPRIKLPVPQKPKSKKQPDQE